MNSLCNANCGECQCKKECTGCGSPFGERCFAAEYIKIGGVEKYSEMKEKLKDEINALLASLKIPKADALYELKGEFVNLEYTLPSGKAAKLLNDNAVYLGTQIEFADLGICYGVVADPGFILVCSYSVDGSEPELVCYKKR